MGMNFHTWPKETTCSSLRFLSHCLDQERSMELLEYDQKLKSIYVDGQPISLVTRMDE